MLALVMATVGAPLRELRDPNTFSALYYTPPGDHVHPLPLLLYLHGAGESGSNVRDLISIGATGTPPVELEHGTALGVLAKRFVTVAPQTDHGWDPGEVSNFVSFLLSSKSGLPPLDQSRLYVTGHSMGGGGALQAAAAKPHRFAAAVPVAPAGMAPAHALKGMPIWFFHGSNDVVVPSQVSEHLVSRLRAAGANDSTVRLTLYEKAPAPKGWPDYDGHGSPMPAYATPELWHWLLEQRLEHDVDREPLPPGTG